MARSSAASPLQAKGAQLHGARRYQGLDENDL